MDIILLIVIVLCVLITYILKLNYRKQMLAKYIDQLPGPKVTPVFGNALQLKVPRQELFKVIDQRTKEYAPLFRSWIGPVPFIHITRPEHAEIIMGSSVHIDKSLTYKFLDPWLGTGLLTGSGMKWQTHRKLITPTFHFKILDIFFNNFVENCEILIQRVAEKCNKPVFDIYPYITLCALDIICETAMGVQVHAQNNTESEYVKAIYEISQLTVQRAIRPWMWSERIFKRTAMGKNYYKNLNVLHGFSRSVIRERKSNLKNLDESITEAMKDDDTGVKKRLAFLDLLLKASAGTTLMTDEEIREEVDTFIFEGHDTTTASICWVLYLLGSHPHYQEKVVEELEAIYGHSSRQITIRDLSEMKYLERCIKEALRLFPSVPFIGRLLKNDVTIDGHFIPKGTHLNIQLYHIHRCPDQFPNPEQFNPDNFLPENIQKRHPFSYVPFSAGPRNCIGQKFALMEEKTILSEIFRKFKVESVEKFEDLKLVNELILRPLNGVMIRITPRNSRSLK